MYTFTDTAGRTWTLELTIGAVKRVQSLLKVNLLDPLGAGAKRRRGKAGKIKKPRPLVTRLQLDVVLLVDVIFALLKPEAEQKSVTDEQFASALGGDAAYQAFEAFMAEWRDFFQRLRRQTEAKAIAANMELVAAEDKRNVAMVDRVTEAATAMVQRKRQKAIQKIEALGACETATDSPESSGSTPTG
jgi:hypothetical protein